MGEDEPADDRDDEALRADGWDDEEIGRFREARKREANYQLRQTVYDLIHKYGVISTDWANWFQHLNRLDQLAVMRQINNADPVLAVMAYNRIDPAKKLEADAYNRLRAQHAAKLRFDAEERGQTVLPEPAILTDLLAEPDEDVVYRVDRLWPKDGRIVLAAQNKSGKTTMVGNLIRSLVDGDDFLEKFTVTPVRRVVLIDNEMSKGQTRRWLREQGIRKSDSVTVISLRGQASSFNILDPRVRAEWAELIGAADALIFDCLRPSLDALGLSEDKDAGRFLEALDELIAACGITELVVVHHMGHTQERSRGDSRLEDWPDAKWRLVRPDDDPARFFSAYGRDVDQGEVELGYDGLTRHLSVVGGSRKQASTSRVETQVIEFVTENPGCCGADLDKGIGGDNNATRAAVKNLERIGRLRVDRGGPGRSNQHWMVDPDDLAAEAFADESG